MADLCKVKKDGPVFRVVDAAGRPLAGATAWADGGGFADRRDAEHLAATINARREAKSDG